MSLHRAPLLDVASTHTGLCNDANTLTFRIILHNIILSRLLNIVKKGAYMNTELKEITAGNLAKADIIQVADILNNAPDFLELSANDKEAVLKEALKSLYTERLKKQAVINSIDYESEKEIFLDTFKSLATKDGYSRAIKSLEVYAYTLNLSILELSPLQVDNYIYSLKYSPATVRLYVAGASSFFTFLHRRHTAIENPFRGTKARPKKDSRRAELYPNAQEVETILNEITEPQLNTIIYIMAKAGLRVGAFNELTIKEGKFYTQSKGKEYRGKFSAEILEHIKNAGLNLYSPFKGVNTDSLKNKIQYEVEKLYKAGKINAPYSAHDFRHYYAVTEYSKDKDIYRVSKLLNHTSIQITETYLKGLNVID